MDIAKMNLAVDMISSSPSKRSPLSMRSHGGWFYELPLPGSNSWWLEHMHPTLDNHCLSWNRGGMHWSKSCPPSTMTGHACCLLTPTRKLALILAHKLVLMVLGYGGEKSKPFTQFVRSQGLCFRLHLTVMMDAGYVAPPYIGQWLRNYYVGLPVRWHLTRCRSWVAEDIDTARIMRTIGLVWYVSPSKFTRPLQKSICAWIRIGYARLIFPLCARPPRLV